MKSTPGWGGLLVVGAALGHPALVPAQTGASPSASPVGTWEWVTGPEFREYGSSITLTIRSDSTLLFNVTNVFRADTVACARPPRRWRSLRGQGDTLWLVFRYSSGRVFVQDQQLVWDQDTFKRVTSPAPKTNRFHPGPASASAEERAKLIGTWEEISSTDDTLTFRPDNVWIRTEVRKDGAETLSCTSAGDWKLAGDTLQWLSGSQQIDVQGERLSLSEDRVYKRVTASEPKPQP